MATEILQRRALISYGLGSFAPTAAHEFCGAFLLIFYTDYVGLDPAWIGYAFLTRMLIDAAIDPAIGYLSDRTRLTAGRRRPYFLMGSLPGVVVFVLAFTPPPVTHSLQCAYLVLVSTLMISFLSLTEIPHMAMSYELTSDYNERVRVIGFRNFIESITSFLAIMSAPIVLNLAGEIVFGHELTRPDCYRIAAMIIALFGVAATGCSFLGTAEVPALAHECHYDFRRGLMAALKNRVFLLLLTMTALIVVANRISVAQLFLLLEHFQGQREEDSTGLLTAYFAGCLVSMPFWVICGKKFDKRRMLYIALVVWPLSYIALVARVWSVHALSGIAFVMGGAFAGILAMLGAMTPEILDDDRKQSGQRREGIFAAVANIVWQAGLGIGYLAVGLILHVIGYQGGETQGTHVIWGLRLSTLSFPLIASIGGMLALSRLPNWKVVHLENESGIQNEIVKKASIA